jgi:hypothetical protein
MFKISKSSSSPFFSRKSLVVVVVVVVVVVAILDEKRDDAPVVLLVEPHIKVGGCASRETVVVAFATRRRGGTNADEQACHDQQACKDCWKATNKSAIAKLT